jgi:hypothetical protein
MASNGAGFTESIVFAPVSNQAGYAYRSRMGMIPSAEFAVYMDDFTQAVTTNLPAGWDQAVIDTSSTLVTSTTAGSLGATGGALIANGGTSAGVAVAGEKCIQLTAGKRFFMETRVQTSIAAETEVQFGLTDLTAVVNPEDLWTTVANNLVAFGTLPGSAAPKMLADKANSGSSAETSTGLLLNTTWHTLAIFYNGSTLYGYQDGKLIESWAQAIATTVPTGVALAPFFGARTGATAGNVTTFDYLRYVIER